MRLRFRREIYSLDSVMRAAYSFTDRVYVHLDADDKEYIVELSEKPGCQLPTAGDFDNELLGQQIRLSVFEQTKHLRELLYARALATSMVELPVSSTENLRCTGDSEQEVLVDWFEKHESSSIE